MNTYKITQYIKYGSVKQAIKIPKVKDTDAYKWVADKIQDVRKYVRNRPYVQTAENFQKLPPAMSSGRRAPINNEEAEALVWAAANRRKLKHVDTTETAPEGWDVMTDQDKLGWYLSNPNSEFGKNYINARLNNYFGQRGNEIFPGFDKMQRPNVFGRPVYRKVDWNAERDANAWDDAGNFISKNSDDVAAASMYRVNNAAKELYGVPLLSSYYDHPIRSFGRDAIVTVPIADTVSDWTWDKLDRNYFSKNSPWEVKDDPANPGGQRIQRQFGRDSGGLIPFLTSPTYTTHAGVTEDSENPLYVYIHDVYKKPTQHVPKNRIPQGIDIQTPIPSTTKTPNNIKKVQEGNIDL